MIMEKNNAEKDKKEKEEQLQKQLDKRLQDLKAKLREQKVALQKFLEQLNALKEDLEENEKN